MANVKLEQGTGPTPILTAYPVVIVGSMVEGKPDFATVAWTGVAASNPPTISVALQHHRYSLKGIRQNMAFSVNIPSADLVKETDFCGLVSGARVNKTERCKFDVFFGNPDKAPLIRQCPVVHACDVVQILNLGSHELIVGRIIETYVSDHCLTDGRPDPEKMNPIIYAGGGYRTVGAALGSAFQVGKTIGPNDKMDTLDEIEKMRKMTNPPRP